MPEAATKEMTRVQLIKEFFYRPGVDTTQSFMDEIRKLTNEDKDELAGHIARYLKVNIKA
jgi:hypothetical protein